MCRRELESEPEGACPSKMMIPDVDSSASCLNGRACLVPSGWCTGMLTKESVVSK